MTPFLMISETNRLSRGGRLRRASRVNLPLTASAVTIVAVVAATLLHFI
jgi:hypothetical protein